MDNKIKTVLLQELESYAKEHNKCLGWFRFAKHTKSGAYEFLSGKEAQFSILGKIAKKIAVNNQEYTEGQIVDMLSNLVNDPQEL